MLQNPPKEGGMVLAQNALKAAINLYSESDKPNIERLRYLQCTYMYMYVHHVHTVVYLCTCRHSVHIHIHVHTTYNYGFVCTVLSEYLCTVGVASTILQFSGKLSNL